MDGKSRKSLEQDLPALILSISPCGEYNAFVHLLTEEFGVLHCVAYGGMSRKGRSLWVPGNVVKAFVKKSRTGRSWQVRGELLYGCVYPIMHSQPLLLMLQTICVLCDETLVPEDRCCELFSKTIRFLTFLSHLNEETWQVAVPEYILWEVDFLRLAGFSLDLRQCAVTKRREELEYLSPKTGNAVTRQGAGKWVPYLFELPAFLCDPKKDSSPTDWFNGLRITGHFLGRDVFSQKNMPVPSVRQRLLSCLKRRSLTI